MYTKKGVCLRYTYVHNQQTCEKCGRSIDIGAWVGYNGVTKVARSYRGIHKDRPRGKWRQGVKTMENKKVSKQVSEMRAFINGNASERSAWGRGVKAYALELVDTILELDADEAPRGKDLNALLLNGAGNWLEYSESGSSLVCNCDIARRLCAPWELRKTQDGYKEPNTRETWIQVQARALYQAAQLVIAARRECNA